MNIIQTKTLTIQQQNELLLLIRSCQQKEALTLCFPFEEDIEYFLLYQNDQLSAALTLFFPQPDYCECIAMTSPAVRRLGLFNKLLDTAFVHLDNYETEHQTAAEFYFVSDEQSADALNVLDILDASYSHSEYIMELMLDRDLETAATCVTLLSKVSPPQKPAADGGPAVNQYTAQLDGEQIGTCKLLPGQTSVFLYDFEISKDHRQKGYGKAFLLALLQTLKSQNVPAIQLQVSSKNVPAFSLYKKTGFQQIETLSYYHYI